MKIKPETKSALAKILAIGFVLIFCLRWFHFLYKIGEVEIAYSYLYYIPIVLGAFFYGIAGGFVVSLLAGTAHSIFVFSSGSPCNIRELATSVASFILIGLLSGLLSSSRKRAGEKLKKAHEELEKRVEERTADLTEANHQLKETQDQLIQAEKLHAVGILASGVALEVKNPLAIIMQGVNYLEKKLPPEEEDTFKILGMVEDSVKTADDIIRSLLDFARITDLSLQPEDINSILEDSLTLIKQRLKFEHHIKIVKEMKNDIPDVLVDKNRMEQVFINIFLNAVQSMPDGGEIIIRSYEKQMNTSQKNHLKPGEKAVIVEIEDTGVGIPEENMKRVFDPFFTTKGPREGAGLGLSVTRSIIAMHNGLIDIKSRHGEGTKAIITLKESRKNRKSQKKD